MENMKLDASSILTAIENQRTEIGLTRYDISIQTGIVFPTFINNFKKNKIPKFNELYLICNAIGLPIDCLLSGSNIERDKYNILNWTCLSLHPVLPSSLLMRMPDKIAIARMFEALSADIANPEDILSGKKKPDSAQEHRLYTTFYFLAAEQPDGIHLYRELTKLINSVYPELKQFSVPSFSLGYLNYRYTGLLSGLWQYPNLAVELLWDAVDKKVQAQFRNKTQFLKESGINSHTYAGYLNTSGAKTSPSSDTVLKVCRMLEIDDIDSVIRSALPDIPCTQQPAEPKQAASLSYNMQQDALKNNLKPVPYLAQFLDIICSLGYNELQKAAELVRISAGNPFSSYMYIQRSMSPDEAKEFKTYPFSVSDDASLRNDYDWIYPSERKQ